jgi:hypothetical protein
VQLFAVFEGLVTHEDVILQREAELAALQGQATDKREGVSRAGAGAREHTWKKVASESGCFASCP